MPYKPLTIATGAALALLTSMVFGANAEDQRDGLSPDFIQSYHGPLSDINVVVIPPQVDAHTTCLQGFGTIECKSLRVDPDPEDCPAGKSLIKMRAFGYLRHVCAPSK
jgi:hypothetical protein